MDTPQATSIWKRPISGRLFVRGFAVFVLAALLAYLYPFFSGVVSWSLHRHPSYWGATFTMPFRWVFDPEGTALTFQQSGPLGFESIPTLSAYRLLKPGMDAKTTLERWVTVEAQLDRLSIFKGQSTDFVLPANNFGGQLRCHQSSMGRVGISLHCITEDAEWHFSYLGAANHLHEVESIMTTLQPEAKPKESKP